VTGARGHMGKRPEADKRKADASNPKEDAIEVMATVIEPLPMRCFVSSSRISTRCSRTFPGDAQEFYPHPRRDKVAVELSPYDLTRGRIVYRYK